jgi:hypothetical protein
MSRPHRLLHRFLLEQGGLVAAVALIAYVAIAPAHIGGGDNAEFATLGTIGGVAHPSGYPLYLLWLRLMSWLPAASPAHATAIATAVLGAAQVLVLHGACRAWGARPASATIAAAVFAASPLVLMFHTEAEVFALNGLVVTTVLLLAGPHGRVRGARRTISLALVAGLGLSNHATCVLVAPVGLYGAICGLRETSRRPLGVVGLALVALAAGLLPYAYLLVTSHTSIAWRPLDGFGDLVHHFLRRDYGSSRLTSDDIPVPYGAHLLALARSLAATWSWPGLAVGLGMLAWRASKRHSEGQSERPEEHARLPWILYAASVVLAGPVFLTRFNIEPIGSGLMVSQRFHLLPIALFAIPIAVALDAVLEAVKTRRPASRMWRLGPVTALAVLALLALTARSLPRHMRAQSPAIERTLRGSLASMPPRSVVIVADESLYFGAGYVQDALGERDDVTVICWPMMRSPEYRERIRKRSGLALAGSDTGLRSVEVADEVLAQGRALFIDPFGGNIAKAFPTYPYGILFRVLPRGAAPPPLPEQYEINKQLLERYRLDYPFPERGDEPAASVHEVLARTWSALAQGLARTGHGELAEAAAAMAVELAP